MNIISFFGFWNKKKAISKLYDRDKHKEKLKYTHEQRMEKLNKDLEESKEFTRWLAQRNKEAEANLKVWQERAKKEGLIISKVQYIELKPPEYIKRKGVIK